MSAAMNIQPRLSGHPPLKRPEASLSSAEEAIAL
jgi:hypothetical protein